MPPALRREGPRLADLVASDEKPALLSTTVKLLLTLAHTAETWSVFRVFTQLIFFVGFRQPCESVVVQASPALSQ